MAYDKRNLIKIEEETTSGVGTVNGDPYNDDPRLFRTPLKRESISGDY